MSQQQQLYRYHTALFCTVLLLYATLLFSSRTAFYSYSDNKVIRIKFMISLRIIMSLGAFYIVQGFTMSTSNPFFVTNDFLHLLHATLLIISNQSIEREIEMMKQKLLDSQATICDLMMHLDHVNNKLSKPEVENVVADFSPDVAPVLAALPPQLHESPQPRVTPSPDLGPDCPSTPEVFSDPDNTVARRSLSLPSLSQRRTDSHEDTLQAACNLFKLRGQSSPGTPHACAPPLQHQKISLPPPRPPPMLPFHPPMGLPPPPPGLPPSPPPAFISCKLAIANKSTTSPFHWEAVKNKEDLQEVMNIWKVISSELEGETLDKDFETSIKQNYKALPKSSIRAKTHKHVPSVVGKSKDGKKHPKASLLPHKRAQAIAITIKGILRGTTDRNLLEMIHQVTSGSNISGPTSLTEDQVEAIIRTLSLSEEEARLLEAEISAGDLCPEDKVVYDLHNTKGLMSRLRGYAAAKSMKTLTTEAIKAADILTKAAEGLTSSSSPVVKVLKAALVIGNIRNDSKAYGFSLSSLKDLKGSKGTEDKSKSMLRDMARLVEAQSPGTLSDIRRNLWPSCKAALKVLPEDLSTPMDRCLEDIDRALEAEGVDLAVAEANFKSFMAPIRSECIENVASARAALKAADEAMRKAVSYFEPWRSSKLTVASMLEAMCGLFTDLEGVCTSIMRAR